MSNSQKSKWTGVMYIVILILLGILVFKSGPPSINPDSSSWTPIISIPVDKAKKSRDVGSKVMSQQLQCTKLSNANKTVDLKALIKQSTSVKEPICDGQAHKK